MDEALSRLVPTYKIGNDGFSWWVGQIEMVANDTLGKGGWRYKVAIVGEHPRSKEIVQTKQLPWATVMMPVTAPFIPGNIGGASAQLIEGCWVIGFYLDNDKQKPIIMGSIGGVPNATTVKNEVSETDPDKRFKTGVRVESNKAVYPTSDGDNSKTEGNSLVGQLSDGSFCTIDDEKKYRVDVGKKVDVLTQEEWCVDKAKKCKEKKFKDKMTNTIGQFLFQVQNNNGNIGTFYVDKYTGGLYSSTDKARVYINKIVRIINDFLAGVKGYITKLIGDAVDKIVKFLLAPNDDGNRLTGATELFDGWIKDLGCKMADLGERLIEWLTNLLMNYLNSIYRNAICQIDELVNGIISKIYQLMNELLQSILGPLEDILGAIAEPLNMIGNAINYILNLLGITCSGTDQTCNKLKQICTTGEKNEGDEKDFLDRLLDDIDTLFGDTPRDYTQYYCDEAYEGKPLSLTTIGFVGGVPKRNITDPSLAQKLTYDINSIEVEEGTVARFTVTRKGFTQVASSVRFQTINNQGTATAGVDYLSVNEILGFAVGEEEKTVDVQTLFDNNTEGEESFFVKLVLNSPENQEDVETVFKKNIAKCTIVERNIKEEYDPFTPTIVDPFEPIDDTPPSNFPEDDTDTTTTSTVPTFNLSANRDTCPEGEFIVYTVQTTGIPNGSILYYTMSGTGITPSDIVGNKLTGQFIIEDGISKITVGIAEDNKIEDQETLTFTISGDGKSVDVLITTDTDQSIKDDDLGVGEDDPNTIVRDFRLPVVETQKIITDDNGGIIEIPVTKTGDAYSEPPIVFVSGEGIGATATALLDNDGFVTEIRVKSSGFGYKLNLSSDNDVRCIIDAFSILSPGRGYTSAPKILVDGEEGRAEAIVSNGLLTQVRVLDRTTTYEKFPPITIIGGGGSGARLIPSLACLDTSALAAVGSTKIGTGRYVDCP